MNRGGNESTLGNKGGTESSGQNRSLCGITKMSEKGELGRGLSKIIGGVHIEEGSKNVRKLWTRRIEKRDQFRKSENGHCQLSFCAIKHQRGFPENSKLLNG